MDEQILDVVVKLEDPELADELKTWLHETGADDIEVLREQGIIDLVLVTFLFLATVQHLAALGFWMRDKTRCRSIYDLRGEMVQVSQDCTNRDGRMIVINPDGHTQVYNPERPADLRRLLLAVFASGDE